MSRRARRTENTVSLFPFLAVLICAMGALILLLLVTTRRIRHQQAFATVSTVSTPEVVDDSPAIIPPQVLTPDPDDRPLEPLFAATPAAAPIDPNDEWRDRLAALEKLHTDLASGVASQHAKVEQLRTTLDADALILQEAKQRATAIEEEKQRLLQTYEQLQRQESESAERAALLRRKIDEAHEQLAHSDSKFTIMPFDGRSGTTRRPIIIECTDTGITFASEGITLRPADLDGFTPRYNPLVYATRALSLHWERKDARSAVREYSGEPYVLLVVRPQGTVAYYVARSLLGPMDDSFGYELVREDQEFMWPESDPEAVKICRKIVARMLAERAELIDSVPAEVKENIGRFSNGGGQFWLEEVDRLRDPQREVMINGQRYSREPTAANQQPTSGEWNGNRSSGSSLPRGEATHESDLAEQAPQEPFSEFAPDERSTENAQPASRSLAPPSERIRLDREPGEFPNPFDDQAEQGDLPRRQDGELSEFARSRGGRPSPAPSSPAPRASAERSIGRSGRAGSPVNDQPPQWGQRSPGGTIGYEREILIRITSTQVTIADETSFPIAAGLPADDLRELLALHLDHHVQSWGEPPRSFYWLPSVKFIVSPGGNQYYERMTHVVQKWKLRSKVEYTLE